MLVTNTMPTAPSIASKMPANQGLDSNKYKNNSNNQTEWALDFFNTKYEITGKERKVLDLGCGSGGITAVIANIFAKTFPHLAVSFTGIDISKSMVAQAQKDYPKETHPQFTFEEGSATHIPYKDFFDLAVSFSTLHFVMDQKKAIAEIYNSLAPQGTVLILVPEKTARNMNPVAGALMESPKWQKHFPNGYTPSRVYFTPEEYTAMMQDAGFIWVNVESIPLEMVYPSKDAFIDSLVAVLNYVPQEIRREFAEDLLVHLNPIVDERGVFHYPYESLHIVAKKGAP